MKKSITKELRELDRLIKESLKPKTKSIKPFSYSEMSIMKQLLMSDKPIYQKDLVESTKLNKSTIAEQLDRMEKRNLIKRIPDKNDKRKNQVVLTNKVLNKKEEIDEELQGINKKLVNNITNKDLDTFFDVLDKMKRNIKQYETDI